MVTAVALQSLNVCLHSLFNILAKGLGVQFYSEEEASDGLVSPPGEYGLACVSTDTHLKIHVQGCVVLAMLVDECVCVCVCVCC